MTVDPPRGPHAVVKGCTGLHIPRIPHPHAERLEWMRVHRPEPSRPVKWTCERCRTVSYELVNRGGRYLIRRSDRTRSAVEVSETDSVPHRAAEGWWQALVHGWAV